MKKQVLFTMAFGVFVAGVGTISAHAASPTITVDGKTCTNGSFRIHGSAADADSNLVKVEIYVWRKEGGVCKWVRVHTDTFDPAASRAFDVTTSSNVQNARAVIYAKDATGNRVKKDPPVDCGNCGGVCENCQDPPPLLKLGACCAPPSQCDEDVPEFDCHAIPEAHFLGDGTTCPVGTCMLLGACCLDYRCANDTDDDADGTVNDGCPQVEAAPEAGPQCDNNTDDDADGSVNDGCLAIAAPENCPVDTTEEECIKLDGRYQGNGTTSCPTNCSVIPTVSEWGLLVMAILVLSAATVVILRRRAMVHGGS